MTIPFVENDQNFLPFHECHEQETGKGKKKMGKMKSGKRTRKKEKGDMKKENRKQEIGWVICSF